MLTKDRGFRNCIYAGLAVGVSSANGAASQWLCILWTPTELVAEIVDHDHFSV